MPIKKIALGTVQFGSQYGIANRIGKPIRKEAFEMLELAYQRGIEALDTASSYGESEQIIGDFAGQSGKNFKIISKLPDLDNNCLLSVEKYCRQSLSRLKQGKIYGYLIHKFDNLLIYEDLWGELESLKDEGLVHKIGISIYKIEELQYLLNNNVSFDILQIPYSIFDQRFEEYFSVLRERGIEVYARSVFLQGLIFLGIDRINKDFPLAKNTIVKLHKFSANYKIPIHYLCLCFAMLNPFIDKVIIGVDSMEQLKQNINFTEYLNKTKGLYELLKSLRIDNEEIILPYNWK